MIYDVAFELLFLNLLMPVFKIPNKFNRKFRKIWNLFYNDYNKINKQLRYPKSEIIF